MEEAAIEHRRTLRPPAVNDFECFLQAPQTLRGFREDVAVCVGLARVPTSAKPNIQSAVTRTVDCRCHLCEQRRVAIGRACNKLADSRAARISSETGCKRP